MVRSGIGLAVLLICAALVHGRFFTGAESTVLLFVNGWPDWLYRPMWLLQMAGVLGTIPAAAVLAALFSRYRLAVALVAGTGLKLTLESLVKMVVHRQRPGMLEPETILRGNVAHQGLSFVSGHAIVVTAIAALVSPYLRGWWKAVPWTIAAANFIARLYLGAHFPLDLVGGAGLGLFMGALLNFAVGVPAASVAPCGGSANERAQPCF